MEAIPLCIPDNFNWDHKSAKVLAREEECRTRLTVCQEAIDFLKSIKKPVSVICIIGRARTGKSFFLSKIQPNVKFEVGHSNISKTIGMWIGCNKESVMKDGEETEIVLLDCEGTGAIATTDDCSSREWDTQLMTLALLCSSVLIYNSKECPDAVDLENLQFVSNFSNVMLQKFADSENNKFWSDIDFYWLFRDVKLEPVVDGKSCEWGKFLTDEVLRPIRASSDEHSKTNCTKTAIKNTFSKLDAFGIETPTASRKVQRNLDKLYNKDTSLTIFREQVARVSKHIVTNAKVKKINGCKLTGYDLANWVQEVVNELNQEEKSLDVNGLWQLTYAAKVAHEMYLNEMSKRVLPCSNQYIDDLHAVGHQKAIETFNSIAQFSFQSSKVEKITQLENDLQASLNTIRNENEKATHDHCRSVIENFKKRCIDHIDDGTQITLETLYASIASFFQEYDDSVKGDTCIITKERERAGIEINKRASQVEDSVKKSSEDSCIREYRENMRLLKLPCNVEDFNNHHMKHFNAAINAYLKYVTGSKTLDLNTAKAMFMKKLKKIKTDFMDQNCAESLSQCQQLILELQTTHIKPVIDALDDYTFKELREKQNKVIELFQNGAIGPRASKVEEQATSEMTKNMQRLQKKMAIHAKYKTIETFEETVQLFDKKLLPCSEIFLRSKFDAAIAKAFLVFDNRTECMKSNLVQSLRDELEVVFNEEWQRLTDLNFVKSSTFCKNRITELDEQYFQKETASFAELMCSDLTNAYNCIFEEYDMVAKGPAKPLVRREAEKELNAKIRRIRREKYLIQGTVFLATGLVGSGLFNAGIRISKAIRRT